MKHYNNDQFRTYDFTLATTLEALGISLSGLEAGTRELGSLAMEGFNHPDIDISIVNTEGAVVEAAHDILDVIQQVVA